MSGRSSKDAVALVRRQAYSRRRFHAGALATTAAAASLAPGGLFAAPEQPKWQAGFAHLDVTPAANGTFLIGPMKPSTGVNDPLLAKALILSDGSRRILLLSLDYLGFDIDFTSKLAEVAAQAADVPRSHVMVNCSHTHSAPLTAPWGPWREHLDAPFRKKLPEQVSTVVNQAIASLQPVTLRYGQAATQIGFNRRLLNKGRITMAVNPAGAVLPFADVLGLDDSAGRLLGTLFSHAAHPVIVHSASTLISGDYPGFACANLRQALGKDTVHLFAQGCSGNVNGFPLKGGIKAAAAAGKELAGAVGRALDDPRTFSVAARLRVRTLDLELPLQAPRPVDEIEARLDREKNPQRRARLAALLAIAKADRPRTMQFPMQAVALGDELCLLGLPHEPFAEYHRMAVTVSPFVHTMVFGYTGGLECYVGTAKDYRLDDRGGYETSPWGAAFMFESRLPLSARAASMIHAGVKRLLTEFCTF